MSNPWQVTTRGDADALALANRHYSRQNPDSKHFVQPGRSLVLITDDKRAVWVTMWPYAQYVRHAWAGAMSCSLFRNESEYLSSDLIRGAVERTLEHYYSAPKWSIEPFPDKGFVTFVDAAKTRKKRDPGRCYLKAGWTYARDEQGRKAKTQSGLYVLEYHPTMEEHMPWKPFKIDESFANTESRQTTPVKDGEYLMLPTAVKPCAEEWLEKNQDKKAFVNVTMKIEKGPDRVGGTYSEIVSMSEGAMFRLGQVYEAIGGDPKKLVGREFPTYKSFDDFAKALTGAFQKANKTIGVLVTSRAYNGKTQNQIAEVYPADQYDTRTQFTQAPAAAATADAPAAAEPDLDDLLGGTTL